MQIFYYALTFLVTSLLTDSFGAVTGELLFAGENIDVRLFPPDTVEVTGEYFFTSLNGMPCMQRVHYPFPADTAASVPFLISVQNSVQSTTIPFDPIENGVSFVVEIPAGDTIPITVVYRQRFGNNTGRYILTTTTFWGRPLSNSRYTLNIPITTTLKYLSYECDTVYTVHNNRIYSFFKKKFMPDRDFIFMWK